MRGFSLTRVDAQPGKNVTFHEGSLNRQSSEPYEEST
jgi:hypothetical protein